MKLLPASRMWVLFQKGLWFLALVSVWKTGTCFPSIHDETALKSEVRLPKSTLVLDQAAVSPVAGQSGTLKVVLSKHSWQQLQQQRSEDDFQWVLLIVMGDGLGSKNEHPCAVYIPTSEFNSVPKETNGRYEYQVSLSKALITNIDFVFKDDPFQNALFQSHFPELEQPIYSLRRLLEANLKWLPLISGIGFQLLKDYQGDDTASSLVHALITGIGSNYLYSKRTKPMWRRFIEKDPPDGLLDTIIPLLTYGYAGFEIYDSIMTGSFQFLLHGGSIFLALRTLYQRDEIHLATDALLMETSTIFLDLRHVNEAFLCAFAATFFFYRLWIFPKEYFQYMKAVYWDGYHYDGDETLHPVVAGTTTVFNTLNFYWGYRILRKIGRRLF